MENPCHLRSRPAVKKLYLLLVASSNFNPLPHTGPLLIAISLVIPSHPVATGCFVCFQIVAGDYSTIHHLNAPCTGTDERHWNRIRLALGSIINRHCGPGTDHQTI